ncbi:HYR domain-containing protein [Flavobacterium cupreum]|uniref:HYR domain-containing protein n=1 Tax=Flavobacterium cupreum TaxID=2133766 RepID=A0A434AAF2_9FLAO|nr:HYR domain-containing protein [Flavobacterium cupreum]RUT71324.1 HYR domain-containing protein [Flavobacterium cupreum]
MENNSTTFKKKNKRQIILFLFLLAGVALSYGQNGCAQVQKSIVDGSNGFSVNGKSGGEDLGKRVRSAGDINGDGIPDLMIAAPGADFGGISNVGEIYVIFGGSGFSFDTFDVSTLNGTNGFIIRGVTEEEQLGSSLDSAGDFNNDGIKDIIAGDNFDPSGQGHAFVFYGKNTPFQAVYTRTDIDNTRGLFINIDSQAKTAVGNVSYAGDINHDGISDVIITDELTPARKHTIVFGGASVTNLNTSSLTGANGFVITGYTTFDNQEAVCRNAGDFNNDGIDDLILGYPNYTDGTNIIAGRVIVLFGKNVVFPPVVQVNLLTAAEALIITSSQTYARMGKSVAAAGDFNADGINDIVFGTPDKTVDGLTYVGEANVLFGASAISGNFAISDVTPANGVVIQGTKFSGSFGFNVNGVGDINNDGKADIAISCKRGISGIGAVYMVFGENTTGIIKEKNILNTVGYQIFDDNKVVTYASFGCDVAGIGDFNQDGKNDFGIGSIRSASFYNDVGNAFIFYGEKLDRIDNAPPTIACPVNQELFANSTLPDYVSLLPNLIDNCTYTNNRDLITTQSPPQGTLFNSDTNVTISATDISGNTSSCTFLVKLKSPVPLFACNAVVSSVNDIDSSNGFVIYGERGFGKAGYSVNRAGDINGDGLADFIVSAAGIEFPWSGTFAHNSDILKGGAYVVFGTASGFPATVDLGLLNGTTGFKIRDNVNPGEDDKMGFIVAGLGDVNGDGIDDCMVSAPYRRIENAFTAGAVYVIFGKTGNFTAEFFLSDLDGTNGFSFIGTNNSDSVGFAIDNIGDFNHDGRNDILIAGMGQSQKAYVLYGKNGPFPAVMKGEDINGTNGCTITSSAPDEKIGRSAAGLGDVNGDGITDIAFGSDAGVKKFIVYGRAGFPATFDLSNLNGTNGFVVSSSEESLQYGHVNKAGDLNHDGFNDMAFSKKYILFGSSAIAAAVDLKDLNGTNGFKIKNVEGTSDFGGIGDFNNDGFDDYIFGDSYDSVYILYGKATWAATVDLWTVSSKDAAKIDFAYDKDGGGMNFAGDLNKDGFDDIIVGFFDYISPFGTAKVNIKPGQAYVLYGRAIVPDTEKPIITNCPKDVVLPIGALIPNYRIGVIVTDNCDTNPTVTQTPAIGTVFNGTTTTVTLTATDASSLFETCSFTITAPPDTQAPALICLADQQLACGSVIPNYTGQVLVSDDRDTTLEVIQTPAEGTAFFDGMLISFTAKDDAGNEGSCSFYIHASGPDLLPPTFSCPTNLTLSCGDVLPDYAMDPVMNVKDNCSNTITHTMTPPAGTPFYDGIKIKITYTDESGNAASCDLTVHSVTPDKTEPVFTCIGDQTLDCGALLADYTNLVTATDNCGGTITITQSPEAGTVFTPGMTVQLTAKDMAGNESYCSFTVNASADFIAPQITCIENQKVVSTLTLPDYSHLITVKDNCDTNLKVFQTPHYGADLVDGMTVKMTVYDTSGNEANCSFTIQVVTDSEPPKITCLSDQSVACFETKVPDYTSIIVVTDNADPNPVIQQNPPAGSDFTDGMTITITATDNLTNESVCSFKVNADVLAVDAGNDVEINEGENIQIEAIATQSGTFNWSPTLGVSNALIANPFFSPLETTTYTVYFKSNDGCEAQDEVTISVLPKETDETKYGFSPNNDGINDFWTIDDINQYPKNKVSVYSRWGDLVFQVSGYNNTTNVFSGIANKSRNLGANELPEGTYFFEIDPNADNHHFKKLKGYLVLKR